MSNKMSGKSMRVLLPLLLILLMSLSLTCCEGGNSVTEPAATPTETPSPTAIPDDIYEGITKKAYSSKVSVHDPSIFAYNGKYYIYGSHMANAVSTDLRTWTYCGNGYTSTNEMFVNLFSSDCGIFDYAGDNGDNSYSVWAPHVIYNKAMGKYCMYMCTSSTYIWSSICFATSDSPEGPFEWQANILYSGFTSSDIAKTDLLSVVDEDDVDTYFNSDGSYNNMLWPNCIDPTVLYDEDGRLWMVYGSWSGGIFLIELDEETGLPIHPKKDSVNNIDPYFGQRLLGGTHRSIEGPYIQYDADAGYYYLFVSYGELAQKGGYQIRVFRSTSINGPYEDMNGEKPGMGSNHKNYGLKLSGNYMLPSFQKGIMATGGQSAFEDTDGKKYLCFHTRFESGGERHEPRVSQYFINAEGWPVMAPYFTQGETISETGYDKSELIGTYYFINQGTDISSKIAQPVLIELKDGGIVDGVDIKGTWEYTEGTYYMHLTYNDTEYSGVFIKMLDQAGTECMCFTAAGANQSIWGVHYFTSANE